MTTRSCRRPWRRTARSSQGAQLVKPIPIGIALRPGDSRIDGIQKAVKDMYDNGTMGVILTRWKFNRYAINP